MKLERKTFRYFLKVFHQLVSFSFYLPFFKEIIAFIIDNYESRKIHNFNTPNGLHSWNNKYIYIINWMNSQNKKNKKWTYLFKRYTIIIIIIKQQIWKSVAICYKFLYKTIEPSILLTSMNIIVNSKQKDTVIILTTHKK